MEILVKTADNLLPDGTNRPIRNLFAVPRLSGDGLSRTLIHRKVVLRVFSLMNHRGTVDDDMDAERLRI